MALQAKLVQKMGQALLMTPQLQQAIKLLQLGRLEYLEAIQKELLDNPVLEEVREASSSAQAGGDGPVSTPSFDSQGDFDSGRDAPLSDPNNQVETPQREAIAAPMPWEEYLQQFTDSRGAATPKGLIDHEDRPQSDNAVSREENLADHLIAQLRMSDLDAQGKLIALHIVGNLNRDGYLCAEYEEIAQSCECEVGDVEMVMEFFRTLDPAGVASRNLQECLLAQLEVMGLASSLESRIVRDHLSKLESRKYEQIAKAEMVDIDRVFTAVKLIQKLEPRPARSFSDETARYIVPDIYVYRDSGEWVVTLNEDGLPKLRVSPYYLQLLKSEGEDSEANRAYLNERLKAASWLIKSIHQRQQTIYKVTQSIVKFQSGFLEHGVSQLKPLVLKQVADDIGMHESTVSRVTTNKYVHTPQGVFELKFFFTTGIKSAGGDVSSSSVKDKIKNIILAESADNPISDQQIVEMLKKENIEIARRTVAKYREGLNILSSSKRKRAF